VRAAKWFTVAATYVMNVWQAFTAGSPALVVLHSVPPFVVFVATEAVTDLRDKLGQAASAAFMNAKTEQPTVAKKARRTSYDEYLNQVRADWRPDATVTLADKFPEIRALTLFRWKVTGVTAVAIMAKLFGLVRVGAPGRNRTYDLRFRNVCFDRSQALYQRRCCRYCSHHDRRCHDSRQFAPRPAPRATRPATVGSYVPPAAPQGAAPGAGTIRAIPNRKDCHG
jgi:hypothetical protein